MESSLAIHPDSYKDSVICSICASPGACCKGFTLSQSGIAITTIEVAEVLLLERRFPFIINGVEVRDGSDVVSFSCTKLGANGRCSIYEGRPSLCRNFRPLTDTLCEMTRILGRLSDGEV